MRRQSWLRCLVILAACTAIIAGLLWIELAYVSPHANYAYQQANQTGNKQNPSNNFLIIVGIILWAIVDTIERHHDLVIALGTVAIAAFTFTLWRATTGQMRQLKQSVDLGRQEFIATHRPKLIVRRVEPLPLLPSDTPKATLVIANVGDTNATVLGVGVDIARRRNLRWLPPGLLAAPMPLIIKNVLTSGEESMFTVYSEYNLTQSDIAAIDGGAINLCVVGILLYRDDNNVLRQTGFYRVYDPERERYDRTDEPDYEYED